MALLGSLTLATKATFPIIRDLRDYDYAYDFDDAAQFGNFNAGYTGTYAGVPAGRQHTNAGLGEKSKKIGATRDAHKTNDGNRDKNSSIR